MAAHTKAPDIVVKLPFIDDGDRPRGKLYDLGLDGRLYVDLSELHDLTEPPPHFVRTRCPDRLDRQKPWQVEIKGHVERPKHLSLTELEQMATDLPQTLMECAGNSHHGAFGLVSVARFRGAPLARVLEQVRKTEKATQVLIHGFDEHSQPPKTYSLAGASWIFPIATLRESGAILATSMNGAPLGDDYGGPVRLLVPGWYGCASIKWVDAIEFVDARAEATPHMQLYASRTHQHDVPALACDFEPARIDFTALPIRVEQHDRGLRIAGLVWGDDAPTRSLLIRLREDEAFQTVSHYRPRSAEEPWALWEHVMPTPSPGRYHIEILPGDANVRARRLRDGSYVRSFELGRLSV